jgi:hypothetical protein
MCEFYLYLKKSFIGSIIVFTILLTAAICFGQTHPTLDNAVICGYQGWFACSGDGSPYAGWLHWAGSQPSPGRQSFEVYPDISEYPAAELYQTGYAALGDGRPAKLFASYRQSTSDLHCKWMQDNGIDGFALQRFLSSGKYKYHNDSVEVHMMRAAEKYNRMFYVMYDGVGNNMSGLESDWQTSVVAALKLTQSPRYAYMNGKPVVCIWGFGLTTYSDNATSALAAVNWFKNNGCYVIGGVPTYWRTPGTNDTKAGYDQVYAAFDMVSPWTVGRYKTDVEVDNYKINLLVPDKAKLDAAGKAYMPVMFPGFAWSNWNGGARNDFPRRQGKFMWRQFYNIKSLGLKYAYVAMFDEYDEGTAIMKGAADYFDIPTNQYFQTMSTDTIYISSDFYLRLAGAAARSLKSTAPITLTVPIPNSIGPIFFRSSFEPTYDAQLTWVSRADSLTGGFQNVTTPLCARASGTARSGSNAVRYSGTTASTARAIASFRAISAGAIPVDSQMTLTYAFYPQTALGRFAGIDLVMTDGTTLRSTAAVDTAGVSMNPATGRGTVGQWTMIKCAIGRWLLGKTIDRILVVYDHTGEVGQFNGFIDNVTIQSTHAIPPTGVVSKGSISREPDSRISASYSGGTVWINGNSKGNTPSSLVRIYSCNGREIFKEYCTGSSVPVSLRAGVYFVRVESGMEPPLVAKLAVGK